ncbi:hypothetical protein GCM10026983_12460 [Gracilibacillus alcaliphilus]
MNPFCLFTRKQDNSREEEMNGSLTSNLNKFYFISFVCDSDNDGIVITAKAGIEFRTMAIRFWFYHYGNDQLFCYANDYCSKYVND